MDVVKKFEDLSVDDEILIVDYVNGCLVTHQGIVTKLLHNEIHLNEKYSIEWYDDTVTIKLSPTVESESV